MSLKVGTFVISNQFLCVFPKYRRNKFCHFSETKILYKIRINNNYEGVPHQKYILSLFFDTITIGILISIIPFLKPKNTSTKNENKKRNSKIQFTRKITKLFARQHFFSSASSIFVYDTKAFHKSINE